MELCNLDPYKGAKVYGPYKNKKDSRSKVCLILPDGKRKTISYPKYLMEIHIGKLLEKGETIDHIDKNFLNDDISNLQILNISEHIILDAKRVKDIVVVCVWCKCEFLIKGSKISQRGRDRNISTGFCSKKCTGQYGAEVQNGRVSEPLKTKMERVYYSNKDLNKINSEK